MQSLSDDERRDIIGGILFDELKIIREYVSDIPHIKRKLHEMDKRLMGVEHIVQAHEIDIKQLIRRMA